MKCIIVAFDKNRLIGSDNKIPWQGELPADMIHFRRITTGGTIIMGRKTYDSIGCPLPSRQNIVITRQQLQIKGVEVVHSLTEAYKKAAHAKSIYIIGGGQIYKETLPSADKIIATTVNASFVGDTYFPELSSEWQITDCQIFKADSKNKYDFSLTTYSRRR